jgi:hypothetical protein
VGKSGYQLEFYPPVFTHKIELTFYTLSIGHFTMDEQSWGWFADIDDEQFIDFVQTKEVSKNIPQRKELSKKFPPQPCDFIFRLFATPILYLIQFKYAFHLAQIQNTSQK